MPPGAGAGRRSTIPDEELAPPPSPASRARCSCSAPTAARRPRPTRALRADREAALGHDRADPAGLQAQPDRRALAAARPRGDDPGLRRQHEDQRGLRRGRRGADAEDRPAPVRERDGQGVQGQRRHRRQLQRLPARGQLHQGRLRRRRPRVLQPARARASRRSTSSRATRSSSARTRWPTCASATPTPTSSATRASRTSCARRRDSPRSTSSRASTTRRPSRTRCASTSASTRSFLGRKNIAGLLKTAFYLAVNHAPVNQIALQGVTETENPTEDTRLYISNENVLEAYEAFMTGEKATRNPERDDEGQEGQEAGQGLAHERAGERAPAGRGHGGAGRAAG